MILMNHISNRYLRPIKVTAFAQAVTGLAISIIPCGNLLTLPFVVALVSYWAAVLLMVLRRPNSPTPGDIRVVYLLFWAIWGVVEGLFTITGWL